MKQLTLLFSIAKDSANTLKSRIYYLQQERELPSLEGRDDVILLSNDAIFVDQTTAHGIYSQLCAGLNLANHPYLVLPLDADASVVVGEFPDKVKSVLEKYSFPFAAL